MTDQEVASWMVERLKKEKYLYQETVVYDIMKSFGEKFIYYNDGGNPAISRTLLKEFRKLTEDTAVWERGERMWRLREKFDGKGRSQD